MNPYQNIPIGIPVSKNPYPSHPYSQNFPDESQSESSQMQTPLIDHHQQYHPPDFFKTQQQASTIKQSGPVQAYYSPDQYVMAAGLAPVDPERIKLEGKIKDVEKKLGRGICFAYLIWLYINIFCSYLVGIPFSLLLLIDLSVYMFFESGKWLEYGMALILVSWCVWSIRQCNIMKNAIKNKSLEGARRGFRSMMWYTLYSLITFIVFLMLDDLYFGILNPGVQLETSVMEYVKSSIFFCVPPMLINILGATKVMNLLAHRETLVLELNTQYETAAVNSV